MCVQGEWPLCELLSDGSTIEKENIRSVIRVSTSIHLVYVRIPVRGSPVLTSIHLVYVRVPGKGISIH
jgi:hypothetical protein